MLDGPELRAFTQVGRTLSFARAARALGLTSSAVSKAVARLEQRLGTKLLVRTTRSVRLTDSGALLLERVTPLLGALDDAERVALAGRAAPSGRLRLELPLTLGVRRIVPLLPTFSARYPELELDVRLDDRYVDLVAEGVDAAVRVGELADSRLVARKLAATRVVTVASPKFLRKHGRPRAPEELAGQQCLLFRSASSGRVVPWRFTSAGRSFSWQPERAHTFSNSEALVAAASAGFGVAQLLDFAASDQLKSGGLSEVLAEFSSVGPPISLLCAPGQQELPKFRVLAEFLREAFGARVAG
ncbi:MAG TPA: LysR family transcriptional regulator [Polyangiaceae bacterium]